MTYCGKKKQKTRKGRKKKTDSFLPRSVFLFSRILTLIGYEPNEVIGKTAYYFHNPLDAPRVSDCHSKCKYMH